MAGSGAFVIEGFLNLVAQEGGYVGPDWEVSGRDLADLVIVHFNATRITYDTPEWNKMPYHIIPGDTPIGRVRITIERLPDG